MDPYETEKNHMEVDRQKCGWMCRAFDLSLTVWSGNRVKIVCEGENNFLFKYGKNGKVVGIPQKGTFGSDICMAFREYWKKNIEDRFKNIRKRKRKEVFGRKMKRLGVFGKI